MLEIKLSYLILSYLILITSDLGGSGVSIFVSFFSSASDSSPVSLPSISGSSAVVCSGGNSQSSLSEQVIIRICVIYINIGIV